MSTGATIEDYFGYELKQFIQGCFSIKDSQERKTIMKVMVIGASGYLGNTIYKKLKMCSNDDIYGTCCKSNSQNIFKINLLNSIDINKLLECKPDVIIMSIYDFEEEMSLSLIGINEIVNCISQNTRLIYVSTTVGKGKQQVEQVSRKPNGY